MILVVKLPPNKPPFLGVLFKYENEGALLNFDLVESYKGSVFRMVINCTPATVKVMIICEEHLLLRTYLLGYEDKKKLKIWAEILNPNPPAYFNFSHITQENGNFNVVKTNLKKENFIVKIDRIDIAFERDFLFDGGNSPFEKSPQITFELAKKNKSVSK